MSYIEVVNKNQICTIKMTRLRQKNALSLQMYADLVDALDEFESNEALRVAVVQGDASCFCAGNDLKDFMSGGVLDKTHPTVRFIRRIASCNKPVVGAVAGPAVGIGTTMLLHFDMVIAADNSLFKLPFAQLGLCPEAASSLLLPNLAGSKLAFEYLVLGRSFDALAALKMGLINEVTTPESVLERAGETAEHIAALPLNAVKQSKALIKQPLKEEIDRVISQELAVFQQLLDSGEAQARIQQFFS